MPGELLLENGSYILQENSGKLIIEPVVFSQTLTESSSASDTITKLTARVLSDSVATVTSLFPAKNGIITTGPNAPTTASTANTGEGGTQIDWTNPGNIKAEDGVYATVSIGGSDLCSYYLEATGFGFSIPSSALIKGIQVDVKRYSDAGSPSLSGPCSDEAIRIIKGGTVGTTDKSNSGYWPTTLTYTTYGSSTDLWGETWTASDINNSTFGFALAMTQGQYAGADAYVDFIRITISYSLGTSWTKSLTELITTTASLFKTPTKLLTETKAAADTLIRSTSRTLSEAITGTAVIIKSTGRTLFENITSSDTFTSFISKVKTLTEAITATDTFTRILQWTRTLTESVTATDSVSARAVIPRTFSEAVTAAASISKSVTKVLIDSATASASLIRSIARTLSENTTATDTTAFVKSIGKQLFETASAIDTLTRSIGRTLAATVSTAADLSFSKIFNRTYSESTTPADTLKKTTSRNLIETITASDTFSRLWTVVRTLKEQLTASDTLKKLLNGSDVIWSSITKSVASWTSSAKSSVSSWLTSAKSSTSWTHQDKN